MLTFFKNLAIPAQDAENYVKNLKEMGYENVMFFIRDVSEEELVSAGVKPGHIKRILKSLKRDVGAPPAPAPQNNALSMAFTPYGQSRGTTTKNSSLYSDVPYETDGRNVQIGGFKIAPSGIEKFATPGDVNSSATHPEAMFHFVPRNTKENSAFVRYLGHGGSSLVSQEIYMPTLTILAIKSVSVNDKSRQKQLLSELQHLFAYSRYPLFENKTEALRNQIRSSGSPTSGDSSNSSVSTVDSECITPIAAYNLLKGPKRTILDSFPPNFGQYGSVAIKNLLPNEFILPVFLAPFIPILLISFGFIAITFKIQKLAFARPYFCGYAALLSSFLVLQLYKDIFLNKSRELKRLKDRVTSPIEHFIDSHSGESMPTRVSTLPPDMELEQTKKSPFIVKFYDAYTSPEDGVVCIVLEYMTCGSFQDLRNKNISLNIENVAVVTYSVLRAIQDLHSHNIMHRDIKPGNILFNSRGEVKLSDFGIVRDLSDVSFTDTFVGTIQYMSPERLMSEEYSFSSDIWSLGLSVLNIYTKKTLNFELGFREGMSQFDLDRVIGNEEVHPQLLDFVRKCLIIDPKARPNAMELLAHPFLEEFLEEGIKEEGLDFQPLLQFDQFNFEPPNEDLEKVVQSLIEWKVQNLENMNIPGGETPKNGETEQSANNFLIPLKQISWLAYQLCCDENNLFSMYEMKRKMAEQFLTSILTFSAEYGMKEIIGDTDADGLKLAEQKAHRRQFIIQTLIGILRQNMQTNNGHVAKPEFSRFSKGNAPNELIDIASVEPKFTPMETEVCKKEGDKIICTNLVELPDNIIKRIEESDAAAAATAADKFDVDGDVTVSKQIPKAVLAELHFKKLPTTVSVEPISIWKQSLSNKQFMEETFSNKFHKSRSMNDFRMIPETNEFDPFNLGRFHTHSHHMHKDCQYPNCTKHGKEKYLDLAVETEHIGQIDFRKELFGEESPTTRKPPQESFEDDLSSPLLVRQKKREKKKLSPQSVAAENLFPEPSELAPSIETPLNIDQQIVQLEQQSSASSTESLSDALFI